jgi:hypothetical protein
MKTSHTVAHFGFGFLLATFAAHQTPFEPLPLGATTLLLTYSLTILCFIWTINEYKEKNILKGSAFLLAGLGTGLIGASIDLMNSSKPMRFAPALKYIGVLPPLLLMSACLIFAYTHNKDGKTLHMICSLTQALGLSFIFIGALQEHGTIKGLPYSGKPLHRLNLVITIFAALASLAAFVIGIKNVNETQMETNSNRNKNA